MEMAVMKLYFAQDICYKLDRKTVYTEVLKAHKEEKQYI